METISSISDMIPGLPSVVTVGVFDGVHLGHQEIMRIVRAEASAIGARSVVVTFDRNPVALAGPGTVVPSITTLQQKLDLIEAQGIGLTVVLPVSKELMGLTAECFVTDILYKRLKAVRVVVGSDFVFGKGRSGSIDLLRRMGSDLGFDVIAVPPVSIRDTVVSSTAIRRLILDGSIEKANELLGHPYVLQGKVVAGDAIGRTIGFPTANIEPAPQQIIPGNGIYTASLDLGNTRRVGVVNIGARPTVGGKQRTIELHILDYSGDLYGSDLDVAFHHRLRGEQRFPDLESLKVQIAQDINEARRLIG